MSIRNWVSSCPEIYSVQQNLAGLGQGLLNAMYLRPPTMSENEIGFLASVSVTDADAVRIERELLTLYDGILPQIDRALGASTAEK